MIDIPYSDNKILNIAKNVLTSEDNSSKFDFSNIPKILYASSGNGNDFILQSSYDESFDYTSHISSDGMLLGCVDEWVYENGEPVTPIYTPIKWGEWYILFPDETGGGSSGFDFYFSNTPVREATHIITTSISEKATSLPEASLIRTTTDYYHISAPMTGSVLIIFIPNYSE